MWSVVIEIWSNKWDISFQEKYITLMQLLLWKAEDDIWTFVLMKNSFSWNGIFLSPYNKALQYGSNIKHCLGLLYLKASVDHKTMM